MSVSTENRSPKYLVSFFKIFTSLLITIIFFVACSEKQDSNNGRIVIGIESDVQTINPMYAFSYAEGNLIDLLYMKPANEVWNDSLGVIEFRPMLAEKWEWSNNGNTLKLYFRKNILWSDGVPITTDDIVYTFRVYSDPKVESRFYGQFNNFYTLDDLQIDIEKTFKIISPTILEINFRKDSNPSILDINLEIIPEHIWSKYKIDELPQAEANFKAITSGPFKLVNWQRESVISLSIDSSSFLYNPENINEIIFKIIPDYKSRITHLKTGAIDLMDNIKSEDIDELKSIDDLRLTTLRGRDYDYIGWNHIDPQKYQKSKVVPNIFFASSDVRKALTYAINRKEIVDSYLGEFGELCKGPVSPIFKTYFDPSLPADEYNPLKAKEILLTNGWKDNNGDGVVEKGDVKFSFDLYLSSGNPRRNYVATIVKNNLKAVGIETNIQTLEMGAFVEKLMKKDFDAWIAGWTIPIPIELNPYWNSKPETGFLNFSSYQNKEKDRILDSLQLRLDEPAKIRLYKEIQNIFYKDEPATLLYWFDNIIAFNKRISKINFSELGFVKNAWDWRVK